LFEALPNQLIQQSHDEERPDKPKKVKDNKKDHREARSKRKGKKVITTHVILNNEVDRKQRASETMDNLNSDNEDGTNKKLKINKTQPIMAYHSQTKTDRSYQDPQEVD